MEKLCSSLPSLSPSEARRYIRLFKEQSGVSRRATWAESPPSPAQGKLTNVRLDHIELRVREIIRRDWVSAQEAQDCTQVSLVNGLKTLQYSSYIPTHPRRRSAQSAWTR